ncbi:MAG: alpha/beta fold hydrolase BchO [Pseudomonadota bacterium]
MDWARISDWPLAHLSRRVVGPRHRWHVQVQGEAPEVLLIHGAGGSTHSFAGVIRALGPDLPLVALDLPGHGFTQLGGQQRSGLAAMRDDCLALCAQEGWQPRLIVAHSAGTAVALAMARRMDPVPAVIGINPALDEFEGIAGLLFPALAKLLAAVPFTASLFAATSAGRVDALIKATGSRIPDESMACYRALIADRDHVDGALKMMSQWSLRGLWSGAMPPRVQFVTGAKDGTVPPAVAARAAKRLNGAAVEEVPGLGHLLHEEDPERIADRIRAALRM